MSLCPECWSQKARTEKTIRQLLYWMIEDMGIDGTSPIGLHIIEHYRPAWNTRAELTKALHDAEGIQDWLAEQTGKIT